MGCSESPTKEFNTRPKSGEVSVFSSSEFQVKTNEFGKYVGQLKDDKKEGKGTFYWTNGDRYEGDFKNDKREGNGKYFYKNGNRYEGTFKDDQFDGYGIFFWNNGDRYEGEYKKDVM